MTTPGPYPHDHEKDVIYFGRTNFRNALTKFGIKTDDRRRHMYVIGKTGMGKTTMLENMILSDIYAGHGCAYIDPHGDTAEKIIDYIPEWRLKDVVYFNPADFEYPIGFNILESGDPNTRHVIAAGLMGVFKKIWPDVWSPRMEHILNNCILTLLENPGNTLLGINRILVDRDFRVKMVSGIRDPVVKAFWITEFEQWDPKFRTEAIAPIQNKVGQFLATALVRNIVAQQKSTINARDIMDTSKIFIVNLSKGRIGEEAMRLLGGMLITKIQLSAMERVDMAETERRDFYMYVDEFQNFATESFASVLSEARKYRLALIMAHQYVEQLEEEVRAAVFGNVGTIATFRIGGPDAVFLENEFLPRFTQEDLVKLAKYEIYLRLMIDGVASEPFSAFTLPPIAQRTHSTKPAIDTSRKLYARPKAQVEAEILKWSEMGGEEMAGTSPNATAAQVEAAFDKTDAERKARKKFGGKPVFTYTCTRCGKSITLPVELDRSRPIYCEDCIEIVREERKSGKKAAQARKKDAPPPRPPIREGEVVPKLPGGEIKLGALKKEKEEEEGTKGEEEETMVNAKPDFLAGAFTPAAPAPFSPPPIAAGTSPTTTGQPQQGMPGAGKKKRKRKKKHGGVGATPGAVSMPSEAPRPQASNPPPPTPPPPKPRLPSPDDGVFPW